MRAETYAAALSQSLEGLSAAEAKKRASAFLELVARRGHESLLPAILRSYERMESAKAATSSAEIAVVDEKHAKAAKAVLGQEGVELPKEVSVRVDDSLIGGFRYRSGSSFLDRSYRTRLLSLYRSLIS